VAPAFMPKNAAHHEILTFGSGLRGRCGAAAELVHPLLGLGCGAVIDRHIMAALFHEMSSHRESHDAETDKSDFSHLC